MKQTLNAVEVLVDETGRLGPLSYLLPEGVVVGPGDAVTVPFGRSVRHGLVLGPAKDPGKATREISARLGRRVDPADMALAFELAATHFASVPQIAARFSPRTGRGSSPLDAGPVVLRARPRDVVLPEPPRNWANRLYLRAPLADPVRIAAREAERLSATGQVLILAPSVRLLERTLAEFESGAARLDSKARAGAWNGWLDGTVRIGIGTRSAALYSADRIAGFVVIEEEHPGHVESSLPYTNARDVARRRAQLHRCAFTCISAAPSPTGMSGCKVLEVPDRPSDWPTVKVVDRSTADPSSRLLPPTARALIKNASVPVVTLAESSPSRRICSRCSEPRPCAEGCTGFCEHRELLACPRCSSLGVSFVGWDKTRLAVTVPSATPVTFAELASMEFTPRVVLMLNVDTLLNAPGLQPTHTSAAVLLRAAEIAGMGGTLLLVTSKPAHPVLVALRAHRVIDLAKAVWEEARMNLLPPFGRLVNVRVNRERPPRTAGWPGRILGPRRRNGEWEVLVSVTEEELADLAPHLASLRRRGKTRIQVT